MNPSDKLNWDQVTHVDHDKAWNVIRRADEHRLMIMVARALRHLPVSALQEVFGDYAYPHDVGTVEPPQQRPLRDTAQEFVADAMRGKFYVDFDVNSKNCMERSKGTQEFDAKLRFLFERCVEEAGAGDPQEVVDAFEQLFALLREIDECRREIPFWADEGGVFELCIDWKAVVAGYARALFRVVPVEEARVRAEKVAGEFSGFEKSRVMEGVEAVLGVRQQDRPAST